jgi:replicative DNA helicase
MAEKKERLQLSRVWASLQKGIQSGDIEFETAKEIIESAAREEIAGMVKAYRPENFGQLLCYMQENLANCKDVFDALTLRRMIAQEYEKQCQNMARLASPGSELALSFSEGGLFDADSLEHSIFSLEKTVSSWKGMPPIRFGIGLLDDALGGLLPGEICVLVGAPGGMKTSLALNAFEDFIRHGGNLAMYCSVDMPPEEISFRLTLRECFDQYTDLELKNKMADKKREYLDARDAMLRKYSGRLIVVGNKLHNRMTLDKLLRTATIRMPGFLIIDYLTRLKDENEDDLHFVERAMPKIQEFAQDLQIPILLLSQMSRSSRSDQMSGKIGGHSRGGGIIEELATMEIELLRDPSGLPGQSPEIYATITKVRRGVAGVSFSLAYKAKSMHFTGAACRVQRIAVRKPIFEQCANDYGMKVS